MKAVVAAPRFAGLNFLQSAGDLVAPMCGCVETWPGCGAVACGRLWSRPDDILTLHPAGQLPAAAWPSLAAVAAAWSGDITLGRPTACPGSSSASCLLCSGTCPWSHFCGQEKPPTPWCPPPDGEVGKWWGYSQGPQPCSGRNHEAGSGRPLATHTPAWLQAGTHSSRGCRAGRACRGSQLVCRDSTVGGPSPAAGYTAAHSSREATAGVSSGVQA